MAKMYLPPDAERSGIDVTYHKKENVLIIGGWYDHCAGLESTQIPLAEFFKSLGITMKDCVRAFAQQEGDA